MPIGGPIRNQLHYGGSFSIRREDDGKQREFDL